MSSLETIVSCDAFHLAREAWDERTLSLEVRAKHFTASPNGIIFELPVHVWEVLRQYPGIELDLLGLSAAELRARVEREVDERRALYGEAEGGLVKFLAGAGGLLAFGPPTDPREQQVASGLAYYRKRQREQRKIQAEIEKLRHELSPEGQRKRQAAHNRKAERLYAKRRLEQQKAAKAKASA